MIGRESGGKSGGGNAASRSEREQRPTKFHSSFLKILTGSDLSQRRIPYMRAVSHRKGPIVWLTACCHGDEVGGIIVVQEVFKRLRKMRLEKGAIHAFPLMNPLGFEAASRQITMSKEDLNRSFPGNPSGTLAQRLADKIFRSIRDTNPTIVIDLHNDWIRSIPYAVVDHVSEAVAASSAELVVELAAASGLLMVKEQDPLRHSLSHSLLQFGIPALTMELGESFVVNEVNVDIGVRSVYNLLSKLKMVSDVELFRYSGNTDGTNHGMLSYRQTPNSSSSGIIRFLVRAGETVTKGQPVAKIVNALGKQREIILAPEDGIVLGLSDSSVAFPGAPVMAFGLTTEG